MRIGRLAILPVAVAAALTISCAVPTSPSERSPTSEATSAIPAPSATASGPPRTPAAPTTPDPVRSVWLTDPPAFVTYEARGVPESAVTSFRTGIASAHTYLDQVLAGDRPRKILAVVHAITTTMHEIAPDGSSIVYLSTETIGPVELGPDRSREYVGAHEYVHTWQHDIGCLGAPTWFREGMAEFIAYTTVVKAGGSEFLASQVAGMLAQRLRSAGGDLLAAEPAVWTLPSSQRDLPYTLGFHAVRLMVNWFGPLKLRTFCEAVSRELASPIPATQVRPYWQSAFRTASGIELDEFYARFEEHRQAFDADALRAELTALIYTQFPVAPRVALPTAPPTSRPTSAPTSPPIATGPTYLVTGRVSGLDGLPQDERISGNVNLERSGRGQLFPIVISPDGTFQYRLPNGTYYGLILRGRLGTQCCTGWKYREYEIVVNGSGVTLPPIPLPDSDRP